MTEPNPVLGAAIRRDHADELKLLAEAFPGHWDDDHATDATHPLWPTAITMIELARKLLATRKECDSLRARLVNTAISPATVCEIGASLKEAGSMTEILIGTLICLANAIWRVYPVQPASGGISPTGTVFAISVLSGICGALTPSGNVGCNYPGGHGPVPASSAHGDTGELYDHANTLSGCYWNAG